MVIEWLKNIEITDIIAIYAALVSTVALMWNVVNSIIEKTARVKINIGINTKFTGIVGMGIVDTPIFVLSIIATNISPFDLYINKPMFQGKGIGLLPRKIDDNHGFYVTKLNESENYPLHLRPREQLKTDIEINGKLLEMLKKYRKRDNLIVKITDTSGKAFYSNKIKLQSLLILEDVKMEN